MKNQFYLLVLLILTYGCTEEAPPKSPPVVGEWYDLLEDRDLGDWDKRGDFQADFEGDALLLGAKADGQQAILISKAEFENFQLEFDIHLGEAVGGVLMRFDDRLRTVPEMAGYKINLDHNSDQQNPLGTIVQTARAKVLEDVNADEWHSMMIEANGDHLKVFLNDQLLAETHNSRRSSGKIGLQVPTKTGSKIGFRNLKVQPLEPTTSKRPILEEVYAAAAKDQMEPMFDGKTLTGWTAVGDGSWEVKDGVIHGYSGEKGGFLVSDKVYKNFYLQIKFKIIKEDNSGIFIRKSPDRPDVSLDDALECNIYDFNGPSSPYTVGSIVNFARAWSGMIDYEDWNTMEIYAKDDQITMYVNDLKSAEAHVDDPYNKAGNICLQAGFKVFAEDKGPSDIYFKDVMIKGMDEAQ